VSIWPPTEYSFKKIRKISIIILINKNQRVKIMQSSCRDYIYFQNEQKLTGLGLTTPMASQG